MFFSEGVPLLLLLKNYKTGGEYIEDKKSYSIYFIIHTNDAKYKRVHKKGFYKKRR